MGRVNGLTLLGMAVAVLILTAAANQFFIEHINSDYLFGFETARTLLQTHTLAGQNFPIAPYYFPDLLVLMLLSLFTLNITLLHFLYSILFLSVYLYLVYRLFKSSGFSSSVAMNGALFCLLSYFCILPDGLRFLREWPLSHQSVLLMSLFCLCYYMNNKHCLNYWLIATLQCLCFMSDKLLFVQFMAPFTIILINDFYNKKINGKTLVYFCGIFLVIFVMGGFINDFLTHYFAASFSFDISLYRVRKIVLLGETLHKLAQFFQASYSNNTFFYQVLLVYNSIALSLAVYLFADKKAHDEALRTIVMFLCLAQLINLVLAILSGKLTDADAEHFRYVDTMYVYPPILVALLLMRYLTECRLIIWIMAAILVVSCGVFYHTNFSLLSRFSLDQPYYNVHYCLDTLAEKNKLKNGLAEYWQVRFVRMLSKNKLMISQVDEQLHLLNKIDNRLFFYADSNKKIPLQYQFIIVNQLPSDLIIKNVGMPDQIAHCGELTIWLYLAKNSQARLNHYFVPQFAIF